MPQSMVFDVFHNALWIAGLALALAALSYTDWQRKLAAPPRSLRQALNTPGFQAAFTLGLVLFCVGVALGDQPWWQRILWAVLAVASAWLALTAWKQHRRSNHDETA